jgi:formate dehydrogenase major subunit
MAITRRTFLQYSAATGAGVLFGVFDLKPIVAYASANPPVWTAEALSVGCYCSGGCGLIVGTVDGSQISGGEPGLKYAVYVQGNPDSPINRGGLCSKCVSSAQISTIVDDDTGLRIPNPKRMTQPLYRAPGATSWTPISWSAAISGIAAKVKATRDATFTEMDGSITVNRCSGIGMLGGSSLNNQAAYLMSKLYRALGVVYMETQARN